VLLAFAAAAVVAVVAAAVVVVVVVAVVVVEDGVVAAYGDAVADVGAAPAVAFGVAVVESSEEAGSSDEIQSW